MQLDVAIQRLAARQRGVVTRRQLVQLGATADQIERRSEAGLLQRVHRGVYVATTTAISFEQRVYAACLATGPRAFASHQTATHLWGLTEDEPIRPELTVPATQRPRLKGVVVHRSAVVGPPEHTARGGIPIARPMRALLDLASTAPPHVVAMAVDRALFTGLAEVARLVDYAEDPRFATRKGSGVLRRIANDRKEHGHGESTLESVMFDLLDRFALPRPTRQFRTQISGRIVRFDLCYPDAFIAIEVDGEGPHRSRWQSDHDRHNVTELSRWRVLRFTWEDVTQRQLYVAMTIADALNIKPARWVPDRKKRPS